ncbi:MAG: N-acetylneuraminate synthase family protein, partial [Alphaproteobacteria bacterium]
MTAPPLANPTYQVLLYHGVHGDDVALDLRNSSGKHISRSRFDKEMRILRDARPIVTMADIAAAHRGERDLPHGAVAVTFDDGYRNNYEIAWPVLRHYAIPATIYLTTGYIGTGKVMWTDRLEAAILAAPKSSVTIETRDRARTYELQSIAQKIEALNNIKAICKRLPNSVKDQVVDDVCRQLGAQDMPDHPLYRFMNWDQVREMNASPLTSFGAHTITHASLLKVPEDRMRHEITQSIATVSQQLGAPCHDFAYPEGLASDYNDTVISHLRTLGIDHAPSAIDGTNQIGHTDPFHIRRQMVGFDGRPFPIAATAPPMVNPATATPSPTFTLFGRDLASEVAIIAEIGVNHEGDLASASKMVELAAEAGADAVKFQSYTPNRFVAADDAERLERVTRFALDEADHRHLAQVAKRSGIAFFSSAITEDWVPLIAEIGAAIKIASGDLTFEPVIRLAARQDRPLLVSTGAGTTAEVARMIGWVREERAAEGLAERLVVMHCVSEYPTPLEHAN